jgi:Tfp pilus assembly protein PilF
MGAGMDYPGERCFRVVMCFALGSMLSTAWSVRAQVDAGAPARVHILGFVGQVLVARAKSEVWDPAYTNQVLRPGDQVRTLSYSRLILRWHDNSTLQLPELSHLEIEPQPDQARPPGLTLLRGLLYFFHGEEPTQARFRTRAISAAVRGTEFVLEAAEPEGRTILTVLDGEVEFETEQGTIRLVSGEQGMVEPGLAPRQTAVLSAVNVIQWCLYYPAVLDLAELELSGAEQAALSESIAAYRSGDLLGALGKYPAGRAPTSPAETLYRAALLLAVGQVERIEALLNTLPREEDGSSHTFRLAGALRTLIAATKGMPPTSPAPSSALLASEWLAQSYQEQSRSHLGEALDAARRAVAESPEFGLGWARVAELEFSFGRTRLALGALEKALRQAPRHAQAQALRGFLLSAQNKLGEAITCFERAMALDSWLGNAWLGRGLCRIRQGQIRAGKDDIQVAATVEPQRAVVRSYLSKAYSEAGEDTLARREIQRAEREDPNDPTSWLYRALLNQQDNRVNEAIQDLEMSQRLNDNRSVYRSELLLDQDRAVRGANLAALYRDAGMLDVSVRQAGRAVNDDYANYSAHLFLANSYLEWLNNPTFNQRYETARTTEYLVATLLAPVGAGVLSPRVSQQEYSRLFERDQLGFFSETEYLSRGAWSEYAAQYGRYRDFSYSLDLFYQSDPGQQANNDLELLAGSVQLKQQLTPSDTVLVEAVFYEAEFGDLAQRYDPGGAFGELPGPNRFIQFEEEQEPLFLAGYHHEWGPGSHTLFLGGRLDDTLDMDNPIQQTLLLNHDELGGPVTAVEPSSLDVNYRSEAQIYTAEAQQIQENRLGALIAGARYQAGDYETKSLSVLPGLPAQWVDNPPQDMTADFERLSFYGYLHWQVVDALRLIGGLTFDRLVYPRNFRYVPLEGGEETVDQLSPKAGLILTPAQHTTFRTAYSEALGGVSLDQSFQLEPSQVAGFNQAWRSIIPESVAGANAAPRFKSWNVSLEHQLPSRTYLGLAGELLRSEVDRVVGVFDVNPVQTDPNGFILPFIVPAGTKQTLDFEEGTFRVSLNQLLAEQWSLGAYYRFSQAELTERLPALASTPGFESTQDQAAALHQVNLFAIFNHPCGFFAQAHSIWSAQHSWRYSPPIPDEAFWQVNLYAGYRFPRRRAELRLGLLNITDQDYRLNPLNLTPELPRERTLAVSCRFVF